MATSFHRPFVSRLEDVDKGASWLYPLLSGGCRASAGRLKCRLNARDACKYRQQEGIVSASQTDNFTIYCVQACYTYARWTKITQCRSGSSTGRRLAVGRYSIVCNILRVTSAGWSIRADRTFHSSHLHLAIENSSIRFQLTEKCKCSAGSVLWAIWKAVLLSNTINRVEESNSEVTSGLPRSLAGEITSGQVLNQYKILKDTQSIAYRRILHTDKTQSWVGPSNGHATSARRHYLQAVSASGW